MPERRNERNERKIERMKLIKGFVITRVGGDYVAVATGEVGAKFNGMLKNNETAAFLLGKLQEETTQEALVSALLDEYDVTREVAEKDVAQFIQKLREAGVLED